ncbi:MAG: cyclic nucleotide-binding domain-containing protein [Myxococcota bacterium]
MYDPTSLSLAMDDVLAVLGRSVLFQSVGARARRSVAERVVVRSFGRGERIIEQGEPGNTLYLIVEGSVRVTVTPDTVTPDTGSPQIPVARLTRGHHFGEQALLSDRPAPRTATVQALEDCRLLEVPAAAFREILEFDEGLRALLERKGRAYLLNRLRTQTRALQAAEYQLSRLGRDLRYFSDRQVVFRQGQPADGAYLLTSGTMRIKFLDSQRRVHSMVDLVAPRLFGERGLLRSAPRSGTAVAVGSSETIFIPARELRRLHESSAALRELCRALENIYDIPGIGRVTHCRGEFLDMPAHCLLIEHHEGHELISYKVIDSDVYSITATSLGAPQVLRYEAGERVRELTLEAGRLCGFTSYGHWSDSQELIAAVIARVPVTEDDQAAFVRDGRLPRVQSLLPGAAPGLLCRCMQVGAASIAALVASGVADLAGIMSRCGAGTICGGCRPHIAQILGHQAWTAHRLAPPVRHTEQIWSFRFTPVDSAIEPFSPGQHVVVRARIAGQWIERSYTLTSTPADPYYEITVKREPQGLLSRWLFEHAARRPTLQLSAPQGEFVIDPTAGGSILFFAGGIGITPALGLLRHLCLEGEAAALPVPLLLDYSARRPQDLIAQDLLEHARRSLPRFRCRQRATSIDGRLSESALVGLLHEYDDPQVYICGPPAFETSLRAMLRAGGIAPEAIHVEAFTSVAAAATPKASHERRRR